MKKLRKMKNQKGFTLVEVIVVLVILAIMAAILIPSLVGYIDKARENSIVTETRSAVQAVQTLASEKYAVEKGTSTTTYTIGTDIKYDDIEKLTEFKVSDTNLEGTVTGGKITNLVYKSGGKKCTYDPTATENYKVEDE